MNNTTKRDFPYQMSENFMLLGTQMLFPTVPLLYVHPRELKTDRAQNVVKGVSLVIPTEKWSPADGR